MIVGFTGSRYGMNVSQEKRFRQLLFDLRVSELHHGDCTGADAQTHAIARSLGIEIVGHPPTSNKQRAFCSDFASIFPVKPYLTRDKDIVSYTDALIAVPRSYTMPHNLRGQGTWTTVAYALKLRRRVYVIFPDGTLSNDYGAGYAR